MRNFTVRRGTFKGQHKIYESVEEANSAGISELRHPWYKDTEIGDWCVSDDGYIVQCLSKYILKNKRHKSNQKTVCYRFPQGTFYVYHDAKGNLKPKNFYAFVANANKSSLGNTSSLGRYLTIPKREFIMLMGMGYDPYSAYVKAFKVKNSSPHYIGIQLNKLLTDPVIQEELMEALKPFMSKVQDKIKEKSGYDSLEDLFIERTANVLLKETKSAKEELAIIEFAYKVFGKVLGIVQPEVKKDPRQIQDVPYEEVRPPLVTA